MEDDESRLSPGEEDNVEVEIIQELTICVNWHII